MNKKTRTILIVEDEAIIAMDLVDAFSQAGWDVMGPVGSLKQAEAALLGAKPHVALLDINLRGQSTFELAERLHGDDVPITFMTRQAKMTLPPKLNGARVFSKPAIMNDVVAHLSRVAS